MWRCNKCGKEVKTWEILLVYREESDEVNKEREDMLEYDIILCRDCFERLKRWLSQLPHPNR